MADWVSAVPNSGNKNATISVSVDANFSGARATNLTISGKSVSKTVRISQPSSEVYIGGASGSLEGWDPDMPHVTSGPFHVTVPSNTVQIRPRSVSGPDINCVRVDLIPDVPPGHWVKGQLILHMSGWYVPQGVEADTWDGNSPRGVFVSFEGPSDIILNFNGDYSPLNMTQYWWIPVDASRKTGFVLYVL